MEKTFHLEIITPQRVIFSGDVIDFAAPGTNGGFEILKNHAAFITSIKIGEMRVRQTDGYDDYYATSGGFVEVHDNKVIVLAETCEKASEIDVNRAKLAHERELKRLEERSNLEPNGAMQAIARARNRMRIAERRLKR
ncbi:F0F1 ATP synthase subunit epsilon [bacterium]|nr:F0F1 ATP synthase subunit epsilon [bacterium]